MRSSSDAFAAAVGAAFLGALVALAALVAFVAAVWPAVSARVVGDLKREVRAQNVVGSVVGDAFEALKG